MGRPRAFGGYSALMNRRTLLSLTRWSAWVGAALMLAACPSPESPRESSETRAMPGLSAGQQADPLEEPGAAPDWGSAFASEVRFDADQQAVVAEVRVAPGFHAYTVGETTGKPLKLTLDADGAFEHRGDVSYPAGTERNLPIGRSVIVEGEATITAPVARKAGRTEDRVKGTLRYQVCTDDGCDRPRKQPFDVEVIAPAGP